MFNFLSIASLIWLEFEKHLFHVIFLSLNISKKNLNSCFKTRDPITVISSEYSIFEANLCVQNCRSLFFSFKKINFNFVCGSKINIQMISQNVVSVQVNS